MKAIIVTLCLLVCLVLPVAANASILYAFWGTAARDGKLGYSADVLCANPTSLLNGTGTSAVVGAVNDGVSITATRVAYYFDTSALAGQTIETVQLKLPYGICVNAAGRNILLDFDSTGCGTNPLAEADTVCFVASDVSVAWPANGSTWDTLTVSGPTTGINHDGGTTIIAKDSGEPDVCIGLLDEAVITFGMTENTTQARRPRLYVWVAEAAPPASALTPSDLTRNDWIPML